MADKEWERIKKQQREIANQGYVNPFLVKSKKKPTKEQRENAKRHAESMKKYMEGIK